MFFLPWVICLGLFNQPIVVKTAVIQSNNRQNETTVAILIDETTVAELTTSVPMESNDDDDDDDEIDTSVSIPDDVIELNVGGEKITTLRSTLTIVPHSKLARMFSKDKPTKNLPMDKQGAAFFDYNPVYFNYLLDQLRAVKSMPKKPGYQLQFQAPYMSSQLNFTHMLIDLGLTREYFLSPEEGTHLNLSVSSLAGWEECYRSAYNVPFDLSVLKKSCNGSRLLVACRPVTKKKILTLAGIGQYEDVFHPCLPKQCKTNGKTKKKSKKLICSSNYQCITQAKRGVGWYNANNQTWGFVRGSLSFVINPCDSSSLDSDYRLCWTSQSDAKQGSGDRCGNATNLQNSNKWERLIYKLA